MVDFEIIVSWVVYYLIYVFSNINLNLCWKILNNEIGFWNMGLWLHHVLKYRHILSYRDCRNNFVKSENLLKFKIIRQTRLYIFPIAGFGMNFCRFASFLYIFDFLFRRWGVARLLGLRAPIPRKGSGSTITTTNLCQCQFIHALVHANMKNSHFEE